MYDFLIGLSGNWIEIAYGTSSGTVRVIVQHPETVGHGPQLFQTFTVHRSPVTKVMLSEKHLVSGRFAAYQCPEYKKKTDSERKICLDFIKMYYSIFCLYLFLKTFVFHFIEHTPSCKLFYGPVMSLPVLFGEIFLCSFTGLSRTVFLRL